MPLATLRYTVGTYRDAARAALALRRAARADEPAEVVDASFRVFVGEFSIPPVQMRSEVTELLALLRRERPRRVLEIGTANGGTLYLLAWAAAPGARVLSLDVRAPVRARRLLYRSFVGRRRIDTWAVDSHAPETRAAVERHFGGPLDVLFVDGDHSYEGVRADYELYAPLVRPGGLVAFHDVVEGPETAVGGVPSFWRDVRGELDEPRELVESRTQGGYGIGVGRVPAGTP